MTTKHTPGPWVVCVQEGDDVAYTVFAKSQLRDGRIAPEDWDNCIASAGLNHQEVEQNAHLIAAAPTLYDAAHNAAGVLIACCKPAGGCDDDHAIHDAIKRLEDAIAKARGEA